MHVLIGLVVGLAITTVLLIGWARGNLFACVFLSLPPTAYLLIVCLQQSGNVHNNFYPGWVLACVGLICVVWAPRHLQH
jgi:FtsH-binding integral membrane protein